MTVSLESIFDTAASGMSAQSVRMNTISSNLANTNNVGSTEDTTYHAKFPVFAEVKNSVMGSNMHAQANSGVKVLEVMQSHKPLEQRYEPDNPLANEEGKVFMTNVNPIEQMTNMIAASREYQANVEIMNTTKSLVLQSLNVLKSKD